MNYHDEGEAPATLTPRINFDQNPANNVIAAFPNQNESGNENVKHILDEEAGSYNDPQRDPITVNQDPGFETRPGDSAEEPVPPKEVDLDELSVEELKQHQEEINRKIREKQEAEKKAVIDQIIDVVRMYKITPEELVDALGGIKIKRKGVKPKPKYRDPVSGALWTGRGKEPAWIKDQDRTKFLINEEDNN